MELVVFGHTKTASWELVPVQADTKQLELHIPFSKLDEPGFDRYLASWQLDVMRKIQFGRLAGVTWRLDADEFVIMFHATNVQGMTRSLADVVRAIRKYKADHGHVFLPNDVIQLITEGGI